MGMEARRTRTRDTLMWMRRNKNIHRPTNCSSKSQPPRHQIDDDEYERWMEMNSERTNDRMENKSGRKGKRKREYVQQISKSHYFNCGYYYFGVLRCLRPALVCAFMLNRRVFVRHARQHQALFVQNACLPANINLPCAIHDIFEGISFSSPFICEQIW